MSDPTRFRDGGGSELERLVFDSVCDEAPSRDALRRVEAAVGVGAAISTTTATTSALGATVKTGVSLGVTKWIGVAAVTVVASATAAYMTKTTRAPETPRPAPNAVHTQMPAASSSEVRAVPVAPPVQQSPSSEPAAVAPIASTSSASLASGSAPPAKPAPTLGDELRLLDEAHAALNAGDSSGALALLDRHDRGTSKPALGQEALALRVEAYARQGDHASAARAARQFLATYGDQPQAQRVRSILEAEQQGTNP